MRRIFTSVCAIILGAFALMALPSPGQSAWEEVKPPPTGGLFTSPNLLVMGDKIHMIWGGTNSKIPDNEFMYSVRGEEDADWTEPRAPFFGADQGRVRRVAVTGTRHFIGCIFQRQLAQSERAMETLFTGSPDFGYSWSAPLVVDSFVAQFASGTCVSVGAREYLQKIEFAAAWSTEDNGVKAAVLNFRDNVRAPARSLGYHSPASDRVEIEGQSKGGFAVVWSDSAGLRSVRLKPLSGQPDAPQTLINKGVAGNFSIARRQSKGAMQLLTGLGQEGYRYHFTEDGEWARDTFPALPAGFRPPLPWPDPVTAVDEDDHMHVLFKLRDGLEVFYTNDRSGTWSLPEKIIDLKKPDSGLSLACSEHYVWAVAAQGPNIWMRRRKLE